MLGRDSGVLLEHMSPNFSTITTSASSYFPFSLGSITSRTFPSMNLSQTQSTRTNSSGVAFCSVGLRPQVTSSNSAPNANTSELVVALPVLGSSGARYPKVPTTRVVLGFEPCSYSLASPKSPSLPLSSLSSNTLLAFISL
ncbi:hypothetical protein CIPAW_09G196700 [Carya illinoinensis]|uniref:Uncharacterized protein n=1 Tax=Carya illinoinensis TaxID=32201 RepID=A0A8T1PP19_CARIL|nr:hypothetical protein CIPAW_09G196700 [Carya illinoinensis]